MPASDMITRRYTFKGASCYISFPAGWSKKCYYETNCGESLVRIVRGEIGPPQTVGHGSPSEAREAAMRLEKLLLARGWRFQANEPAILDADLPPPHQSVELQIAMLVKDDNAAQRHSANYVAWLTTQFADQTPGECSRAVAEVISRRAERENERQKQLAMEAQTASRAEADRKRQLAQELLKEVERDCGIEQEKKAEDFGPKKRRISL